MIALYMKIQKLVPELTTLGIIVVGSLCYPLVSSGMQYAPPLLFAALRTFIAGISIAVSLPLLFHQPFFPPRNIWKWILLLSIPAVAFTYGTMFLSHKNPTMTMVPVLENLQPFLSIFLAITFLHEKLSSATRAVLLFGTIGLILLSAQIFIGGSGFDVQSAIFALLASFSAAATSVFVKWLKLGDVIVTLSAWQFIIGSLLLFVLSQLFELNAVVQWGVSFVSILTFLAVIGTAATTVLWYKLIQRVDVSRLSVLFFIAPALGLVMANRLYGVPASIIEWMGIITITTGIIIGLIKQSAIKVPNQH